MPHIHWVARQNNLKIPNDEEEVNTREIHKCDGQAHDPDTMVAPLTPKPTRKDEALAKASPTIASRREENVAQQKWPKPWLCCANGILETKANDGSTATKAPAPRTNPNTKEAPTAPKPHSHPSARWASAQPRGDDRPTDTQADTKSRSPRQGAADNCLTS
jgi:hypothetical protein